MVRIKPNGKQIPTSLSKVTPSTMTKSMVVTLSPKVIEQLRQLKKSHINESILEIGHLNRNSKKPSKITTRHKQDTQDKKNSGRIETPKEVSNADILNAASRTLQ